MLLNSMARRFPIHNKPTPGSGMTPDIKPFTIVDEHCLTKFHSEITNTFFGNLLWPNPA